MSIHGPPMFQNQSPQSPARLYNHLTSPPFSPVRRKPLPFGSSSVYSSGVTQSPNQSPRLQQLLNKQNLTSDTGRHTQGLLELSPPLDQDGFVIRDLDRFPHGDSPNIRQGHWATNSHGEVDIRVQLATPRIYPSSPLSPNPSHARVWSESSVNRTPYKQLNPPHRRTASAMASSSPTIPANLNLPDVPFRSRSPSISDLNDDSNKPRSPGSRLTSFFRWGSTSEQGGVGSPSTSVSERGPSPTFSPKTTGPSSYFSPLRTVPSAIDIPRANAALIDGLHSDSGVSMVPPTPSSVEAIEEEVRLVSEDLAASIRREMELEDLVERLQAEAAERNGEGKRTSDYFSDAGTSTRYLDIETKLEVDVDKMTRKSEQQISQVRLQMVNKVQEERQRRKAIESHVKDLEEQFARRESAQFSGAGSTGRLKELEVSLEEARRRLAEERRMKENYEDLLTALRGELEEQRNERDNLRDEVLPRLQARVEGLELEASGLQRLQYEHSRMQQELLSLRNESASHLRLQQELLNLRSENASLAASAMRTQASASRQSIRQSRPASMFGSPTLIQSNIALPLSLKDKESLVEKVKDIEEQRDALHSALKSLHERHTFESKRARERIKALELERDKALQQSTRRYGKDQEMSSLRKEMDRLRRRADEALEHKYLCERGLGTLKMDLEKAEQETANLRALLQEHDSLVSRHTELRDSHIRLSMQVSQLKHERSEEETSLSLQQAYNDLQDIHERSLARLDELEVKGNDLSDDLSEREQRLSEAQSESQRAIEKLRHSVAQAESERDEAQVEAEAYRKHAETLQDAEKKHLSEERTLGVQLKMSTERIGELAAQVRAQLESNNSLRERLAEAIDRGEGGRRLSAEKIGELQDRLRDLEDKVLEAQHKTEEVVARHEEEVRQLKETHTTQLRRLKSSALKSPAQLGLKSPLSPLLRSPKLGWASFRKQSQSILDSSRVEFLGKRVEELEEALILADDEMAEVVGKMNFAQIEVMELQSERDEALRRTRKLQAEVELEKAKYVRSV